MGVSTGALSLVTGLFVVLLVNAADGRVEFSTFFITVMFNLKDVPVSLFRNDVHLTVWEKCSHDKKQTKVLIDKKRTRENILNMLETWKAILRSGGFVV